MIVTIGDTKFFKYIKHSVKQLKKIYPKMEVIIYDWGFKNSEVSKLKLFSNVKEIIKWEFLEYPFPKAIFNSHEWILAQKPYCFKHYSETYTQPFMFLDGDAWLLKPVPNLLNSDKDINVTVRPAQDQVFEVNKCRVINSGVFKLNNLDIIDAWIKKMNSLDEYLVEQTSLTRLLYEDNIFSYRILPCEIYNYYWPTKVPNDVKIRHLKGRKLKKNKLRV